MRCFAYFINSCAIVNLCGTISKLHKLTNYMYMCKRTLTYLQLSAHYTSTSTVSACRVHGITQVLLAHARVPTYTYMCIYMYMYSIKLSQVHVALYTSRCIGRVPVNANTLQHTNYFAFAFAHRHYACSRPWLTSIAQ